MGRPCLSTVVGPLRTHEGFAVAIDARTDSGLPDGMGDVGVDRALDERRDGRSPRSLLHTSGNPASLVVTHRAFALGHLCRSPDIPARGDAWSSIVVCRHLDGGRRVPGLRAGYRLDAAIHSKTRMSTRSNKPDSANPAMTLWLTIEDHRRRVADLDRWTARP